MEARPPMKRLAEFLGAEQPNDHQQRVLSAMQWAGRASADWRPEEAFIFRAIALETLILSGNKSSEITNRLKWSVVHLLGDWLVSREVGEKHVKAVYEIRSQIVHSGLYEVAKEDTSVLRHIVIHCFSRVLSDDRFKDMTARSDLDRWFNARLRGDDEIAVRPTETKMENGRHGI
jgi:Apea-like HEPN